MMGPLGLIQRLYSKSHTLPFEFPSFPQTLQVSLSWALCLINGLCSVGGCAGLARPQQTMAHVP